MMRQVHTSARVHDGHHRPRPSPLRKSGRYLALVVVLLAFTGQRPRISAARSSNSATQLSGQTPTALQPQSQLNGSPVSSASLLPAVGNGQIVYVQFSDSGQQIWTMRADGSNRRSIASSSTGFGATPRWSRFGGTVYFVEYDASGLSASIYRVNADGSNRRLVWANWAGAPAPSPDEKQLALTGASQQIIIATLASSATRTITAPFAIWSPPEWSPDGRKLVLSLKEGDPADAPVNLYTVNVDGTAWTKLTTYDVRVRGLSPRWSQDSTRIVFERRVYHTDIPGVHNGDQDSSIRIINSDGSNERVVVSASFDAVTGGTDASDPYWSPDGAKVGYRGAQSSGGVDPGQTFNYLINDDGSGRQDLGLTDAQATDWQPLLARVRGVWFRPDDAVVEDRLNAPARRIDEALPPALAGALCGNTGQKPLATWLDCNGFPDGTPERVWPVTAVRGRRLTIPSVRFHADQNALPPGTTLKADITVQGLPNGAGATLHVSTPFTGTVDNQYGETTLTNLETQESLPSVTAAVSLVFDWRLEAGDVRFEAGQSRHPFYLLQGDPVPPGAASGHRFLSLVDLGTRAAAGATSADTTFTKIWQQFENRTLHLQVLDQATGSLTTGVVLSYWTPWSVRAFIENSYDATCSARLVEDALQTSVGRCGAWAQILVATVALHGVAAEAVRVGNEPGWSGLALPANTYMLVKSWTWGTPGNKYPDYPYEIRDVLGIGLLVAEANYGGTPAQGGNNLPPGLFVSGDHDIVKYQGSYYDPSYGVGGFANVQAWARFSLDGYATWSPAGAPPASGCVFTGLPPSCSLYLHRGLPNDGNPCGPTTTSAVPTQAQRMVSAQRTTAQDCNPLDANGDGSIDIVDALCVARVVSGLEATAACPQSLPSGDVNGDGSIDIVDALCVARYISGLPRTPVCPFDPPIVLPAASSAALAPPPAQAPNPTGSAGPLRTSTPLPSTTRPANSPSPTPSPTVMRPTTAPVR